MREEGAELRPGWVRHDPIYALCPREEVFAAIDFARVDLTIGSQSLDEVPAPCARLEDGARGLQGADERAGQGWRRHDVVVTDVAASRLGPQSGGMASEPALEGALPTGRLAVQPPAAEGLAAKRTLAPAASRHVTKLPQIGGRATMRFVPQVRDDGGTPTGGVFREAHRSRVVKTFAP